MRIVFLSGLEEASLSMSVRTVQAPSFPLVPRCHMGPPPIHSKHPESISSFFGYDRLGMRGGGEVELSAAVCWRVGRDKHLFRTTFSSPLSRVRVSSDILKRLLSRLGEHGTPPLCWGQEESDNCRQAAYVQGSSYSWHWSPPPVASLVSHHHRTLVIWLWG